jgi:FkbM family methyltransferase
MDIRRIIRKLKANTDILIGKAKYSYAQFGEDLIVDSFFNMGMNRSDITYLDIGTNSPVTGNNTYLFYLRKCKGVCVEPDIHLYERIVSKRPNDTVLNAGVGINGIKEGVFYYFPEPYTGWNTFSKEEAEQKTKQTGIQFKSDRVIPFLSVNDIISKNFDTCPDFVSIDVEGLDYQIITSLDFEKYKPAVFCVETMEFNNMKLGKKNSQVKAYLETKGYMVYADTYVNTIFVRADLIGV